MKINVKSKGTQPTCQMPFVLSCEHWFFIPFVLQQKKHQDRPDVNDMNDCFQQNTEAMRERVPSPLYSPYSLRQSSLRSAPIFQRPLSYPARSDMESWSVMRASAPGVRSEKRNTSESETSAKKSMKSYFQLKESAVERVLKSLSVMAPLTLFL